MPTLTPRCCRACCAVHPLCPPRVPRRVARSSLIARLPKGITPVTVVALIHQTTDSYAVAGAIAAASAFGDALFTPLQGRLLDRRGRGWVLVPSAVVYAAALSLLPLLAVRHAPVAVLFGCALLAGAGFPPVSGSIKALWPRLVPEGTTTGTAYAAESLIQQVLLLVAPLLAAVLLTCSGPVDTLWTAAAATLFGTVAFVSAAARLDDDTPSAQRGTGTFGVPEIRVLLATTSVQGLIFGALPVLLYGLAARAGTPAAGALLLAAWVGGGVSGSFRRSDADFPRALTWLAGALAIPAIAAAVTGGSLIAAAVTFGVAGLFLTPVAAASYVLVDGTAPPARRIETFTWMSTALAVGGSAGSALAGIAVARLGVVPAMFLPTVAAGSATAIATLLHRKQDATGRAKP